MIDGWPETWKLECMSGLMAREYTTPAEFTGHFHFSDQSAVYWLGCSVKSGRVRIARIERRTVLQPLPPLGQSLREGSPPGLASGVSRSLANR